jgi:RimJ/RimL family protein N-acetyltransferase
MEGMPQITYWIGAEHSGKGIGTQALALFLELEKKRPLEARTAFDNLPSARVLTKNGFRIAGTDSYFANARDAEIVETIWILE